MNKQMISTKRSLLISLCKISHYSHYQCPSTCGIKVPHFDHSNLKLDLFHILVVHFGVNQASKDVYDALSI